MNFALWLAAIMFFISNAERRETYIFGWVSSLMVLLPNSMLKIVIE